MTTVSEVKIWFLPINIQYGSNDDKVLCGLMRKICIFGLLKLFFHTLETLQRSLSWKQNWTAAACVAVGPFLSNKSNTSAETVFSSLIQNSLHVSLQPAAVFGGLRQTSDRRKLRLWCRTNQCFFCYSCLRWAHKSLYFLFQCAVFSFLSRFPTVRKPFASTLTFLWSHFF